MMIPAREFGGGVILDATGRGSSGGAGGAPGPGRARAESPRRVDWRERGRRDDEERRLGRRHPPGASK